MLYFYHVVTLGFGCFLLTILLVPLSMKLASLLGAMDNPGKIKIHFNAIPRFGGMAIFLSIFIFSLLFPSMTNHISNGTKLMISLSVGGIFLLGVLDDIKNLKPKLKLLFQILSIIFAVLGLFISYSSLSIVYFIFIFIFILGYTNAFNLIDGMDGLASGIAIFISLSLLIISLLSEQQFIIWSASLIMGASLGFLVFNYNPAKIFLGDCGSTFLGVSLAIILSIMWLNSANKFVLLPLLIIAGIPIFDTLFAILRRLLHRKPIFDGDRSHLYDIIMQKGFTIKQTVSIFYAFAFVLSLGGIVLFIVIEF